MFLVLIIQLYSLCTSGQVETVRWLLEDVLPAWAAGLLGAVAGIATAFLMAWVYSLFQRFETDGNVEIDDCVGKNALVYLSLIHI